MALMAEGTKVRVKMYDCSAECGTGHDATIVEVDPDDPVLPYRVEWTDGSGDSWAEEDEVQPA